jgi:hypothetical protein
VIENLLVYRVRFDTGAAAIAKSDQRPGAAQEANSAPLLPSAPAPASP